MISVSAVAQGKNTDTATTQLAYFQVFTDPMIVSRTPTPFPPSAILGAFLVSAKKRKRAAGNPRDDFTDALFWLERNLSPYRKDSITRSIAGCFHRRIEYSDAGWR
jgi:hypothetical protein